MPTRTIKYLRALLVWYLLPFLWNTAWGNQDVVVVATGEDGRGRARRSGRVLEFRGGQLVLETATGRKTTIPADRVLDIETAQAEPHRQGDRALREGRYQDAAEHYQAALDNNQEQRDWVRQRIVASLVRCQHARGKHDSAGRLFISLLQDDPKSPYLDTIPLAWTAGQQASANQVAQWLTDPSPAIQLLGASYALAAPHRDQALQKLNRLGLHSDGPIRILAKTQLWRTQVANPDRAEIKHWPALIQQLPSAQRAGPYHILGLALAAAGEHEQAALAQLRVRILFPAPPQLASEALLAAGKSLYHLDRQAAARQVLGELIANFPQTRAAAEAQQRLESTHPNPQTPN